MTSLVKMDVDEGEVSDSADDACVRPSGDTSGGEDITQTTLLHRRTEEERKEDAQVEYGRDGLDICDRKRPVHVNPEHELSEGEVSEDMESSRPKLYKVDLREFVNASEIVIPENLTEETPLQEAAHAIAQCIREPKVGLIKDVLATIGFKRTMDVLREAKAVQEAGGMETRDGRKPKRSAGGVFLTLLKSNASSEEVKQVYAREKASMKKKRAHMVGGNSKGKRKSRRKLRNKQDSNILDTVQEGMEESKHRKVPDRRQLVSYADLTDMHSSDTHAVETSVEQSEVEGTLAVPGSITALDMVAACSGGVVSEEARLAEDFENKDDPDGLDGLEFDWY